MKEIDEFLRENKPFVKDKPSFILETRQRLEAVEGIKAEVDRQRSHARIVLIVTLATGLAAGVLASALAFLFPVDAASLGEGLWKSFRLFLESWKHYLLLPVAAFAIILSLVLTSDRNKAL